MDITNSFKDIEFRNLVIQKYCNGNPQIKKSDVENITELILPRQSYSTTENNEGEYTTEMTSGLPIASLSGIEHFTALEVLICPANRTIKEIDLSQNKKLRVFDCSGNGFTVLPIGKDNPAIEEIICSHNPIEKQDFSIFPKLKVLECVACNLSRIAVSEDVELEKLDCSYNPIRELNTENNPLLKVLNCNSTQQLNDLHLNKNIHLEELDCGFNMLSDLDISMLTKLKKLICYHNKLTKLNLQNNQQLEYLSCMTNQLKNLDISYNTELKVLDCSSNQLSELDVAKNTKLEVLACEYNRLKKLDVSNNTVLIVFKVFNNQLTEINVTSNTKLERFICSDNLLMSVPDVSALKALDYFNYSGNPIPEPDYTVKGVGTFTYNMDSTEYALVTDKLNITAEVHNLAGIKRLSPTIKKVVKQLDSLTSEAIQYIEKEHPEEDIKELTFSDIIFEVDKTFRFGFDAGDSPAGRLYLYLEFNKNMKMKEEIIYETY